MTVGEALKQERKNLNLTQSAMAAEVISPSFYSKVENNLHEINVNDLLAILDAHCIDILSFFMKIDSKVKTDYFNLNTFTDRVLDIWYNKDLKQLAELQTELTKYTGNDVSFLNLQVELLTCRFKNERNAKLSDSLMQKLRAELFKQNSWSLSSLKIFRLTMRIYDLDQLTFFMASIMNKFSDFKGVNLEIVEVIAAISVNYLDNCYENNEFNQSRNVQNYLEKMPANLTLFAYKLLGRYYQALFDKNTTELTNIRQVFIDCGYQTFIQLLPK